MSFRPHGKARVNEDRPQAWAVCDRCGSLNNLYMLTSQKEYGGDKLIDTGSLVCDECWDRPNPTLKSIRLVPDPPAVKNARVEPYALDETDYRVTEDVNQRITEDDNNRVDEGNQ